MRDIKPLLLVFLSIGLVSTWVYHIYDKTTYSQRKTELYAGGFHNGGRAIKDSLNNLYSATIRELDTRLDSIQVTAARCKAGLTTNWMRSDQLKSEIRIILNKRFFKEDLARGPKKNCRTATKSDELSNQNLSMEEEKKQLEQRIVAANPKCGQPADEYPAP